MIDDKLVYVTKKGKKYHFNSLCTYLKGRDLFSVTLKKAKLLFKNPCSLCIRLTEKNGTSSNLVITDKEAFISFNNNKITKVKYNIINTNKNNNIVFKNNNIKNHENGNYEDKTNDIKNIPNISFSDNKLIFNNTVVKNKIQEHKYNISENINYILSRNINDKSIENIKELKKKLKLKNNFNKYYNQNKINLSTKDIKLVYYTNQTAIIMFLRNFFSFHDYKDKNISILCEHKDININGSNYKNNDIYKGNFKFKLEIIPLKELIKPIKISVGFEIEYIDNTDINVIHEEDINLIDNCVNKKIGSLYETLVVMRSFNIYKKTNKMHVLINISNGKLFVVGDDDLEKINNKTFVDKSNSEILYLRTFYRISLNQIKDVKPIFKFDKNDLLLAEININGKYIDNNILNNII